MGKLLLRSVAEYTYTLILTVFSFYREAWILEKKKKGWSWDWEIPEDWRWQWDVSFHIRKNSLSRPSWHGVAPAGLCSVIIDLGEIQAAFYVLQENAELEQAFRTTRGKGQEDAWTLGGLLDTSCSWHRDVRHPLGCLCFICAHLIIFQTRCKKMHWTPVTAWWEEIILILYTNNSLLLEAADTW